MSKYCKKCKKLVDEVERQKSKTGLIQLRIIDLEVEKDKLRTALENIARLPVDYVRAMAIEALQGDKK